VKPVKVKVLSSHVSQGSISESQSELKSDFSSCEHYLNVISMLIR